MSRAPHAEFNAEAEAMRLASDKLARLEVLEAALAQVRQCDCCSLALPPGPPVCPVITPFPSPPRRLAQLLRPRPMPTEQRRLRPRSSISLSTTCRSVEAARNHTITKIRSKASHGVISSSSSGRHQQCTHSLRGARWLMRVRPTSRPCCCPQCRC